MMGSEEGKEAFEDFEGGGDLWMIVMWRVKGLVNGRILVRGEGVCERCVEICGGL
jgi:hypothetical protein